MKTAQLEGGFFRRATVRSRGQGIGDWYLRQLGPTVVGAVLTIRAASSRNSSRAEGASCVVMLVSNGRSRTSCRFLREVGCGLFYDIPLGLQFDDLTAQPLDLLLLGLHLRTREGMRRIGAQTPFSTGQSRMTLSLSIRPIFGGRCRSKLIVC